MSNSQNIAPPSRGFMRTSCTHVPNAHAPNAYRKFHLWIHVINRNTFSNFIWQLTKTTLKKREKKKTIDNIFSCSTDPRMLDNFFRDRNSLLLFYHARFCNVASEFLRRKVSRLARRRFNERKRRFNVRWTSTRGALSSTSTPFAYRRGPAHVCASKYAE